jgi:C4-dicarboxylate transporter DctM subunit
LNPAIIGLLAIIVLLILIFHRLPIAFAFALVGFVGIALYSNFENGLTLLARTPYSWGTSSGILPLPLFIFMGQIVYYSGISGDLYQTAIKWVGRFSGGIALATNLAATGFAAVCGSVVAGTATMTTIGYPEMERLGYDRRLSTAVVIAGGSLSGLIPPSVGFIIFGLLSNTSVGALFIAGIVPGLVLSALFFITIYILCKINPQYGPPGPSYPAKEMLMSIKGIWGMLVLFIMVMGGMYVGIITPSEAGAIGAFGALILALVRRKLTYRDLKSSVKDTLLTFCFVGTMLIGAQVFNSFLGIIGATDVFAGFVGNLPFSRWLVLAIVLAMFIPLGMILDIAPIMMLTVPFVVPPLVALGFDPLMIGVQMMVLSGLGGMTPPIAISAFIVHGITKVPLETIYRGLVPFIAITIIAMVIFAIFPQISTWLPSMMKF